MYLDALNDQLNKSKKVLDIVDSKFESTLTELKAVCKSKTAVPVDQVYVSKINTINYYNKMYITII